MLIEGVIRHMLIAELSEPVYLYAAPTDVAYPYIVIDTLPGSPITSKNTNGESEFIQYNRDIQISIYLDDIAESDIIYTNIYNLLHIKYPGFGYTLLHTSKIVDKTVHNAARRSYARHLTATIHYITNNIKP